MANSFISDVKEMTRGITWVKFLVKFSRVSPGESGSEMAIRLHNEWLSVQEGPQSFQCGKAKVQRFNFDDDKVVFTFKTEPYSMKSNDYYRYIFDFGKWADARIAERNPSLSYALSLLDPNWVKNHMFTKIPDSSKHTLTIDKTPPIAEKKPVVEINSEIKVKSFISRIINK